VNEGSGARRLGVDTLLMSKKVRKEAVHSTRKLLPSALFSCLSPADARRSRAPKSMSRGFSELVDVAEPSDRLIAAALGALDISARRGRQRQVGCCDGQLRRWR